MKKFLRFFTMALALTGMAFVSSCSDDDDQPQSTLHDYYIEASASGGGLDAAELKQFETELNSILSSDIIRGVNQDEAIYLFDDVMKSLKSSFSGGMQGVVGTLRVTFTLKTVEGKKVKVSTLNITKDSCTIS